MRMAQHLADALYGNIITQAHLGREGVTGLVVSQMLVEIAKFLNNLERLAYTGVRWDEEQVTVLAFTLVFLDDSPGDVKQRDYTIRIGLLAGYMDPLAPVFVGLDVTGFEVGKVCPSNTCETAEHEKVSGMAEAIGVQFKCHHLMKILHSEIVVIGFHFVVFEPCKRIPADNLFLDSLTDDKMQSCDIAIDSTRHHPQRR